ncbi:MAG: YdcF family protein [Candidatus Omnitrophica bacterium]|nr:YdcF family protein [Candidatus Omnitrophota bacterium]
MENINNKSGFVNKLLILFFFLIIFLLICYTFRVLPAKILLLSDNLKKADCIVVLQGDPYFRFKKAVELYNAGYAKNIVVSVTPEREKELKQFYDFNYNVLGIKPPTAKEFTLKAFAHFGKDAQNIYFTDLQISSTYDEAIATKKLVKEKNFKSLILVTSTYHTLRALIIFKLVFKDTDIKIYHCTAQNLLFNPTKWWKKERDVEKILREYIAIIYNIFYHFILGKSKTSFDTY